MSTLNEAKQEVADALKAAGINAYAHDTKTKNDDFAVVEPGTPYLEAGQTFTENIIRFDIAVIGKPITNDNCWKDLDDLIQSVILGVWDVADVESVSQPGTISLGTKTNVAATVTVTASINLKEI